MDAYRFYVPDLRRQAQGGEIGLPEDQAHHLRAVLRLEAGEPVVLFDGAGAWAEGTLTRVGKAGAWAKVMQGLAEDAPPVPHLTIATAVPKGDRAEWLIEQASQLGVSVVQWVDCDRSVVKPREGGQKMEKWRRQAVESAKQCGRTHVLRVEEPVGVAAVLGRGGRQLWLEPRAGGVGVSAALAGMPAGMGITALIGPEGGWSEEEWRVLEGAAGEGRLQRVRLTPTVLRIETACAAVAAIVMSG